VISGDEMGQIAHTYVLQLKVLTLANSTVLWGILTVTVTVTV